jgi:proteasome lid subunit RPN8/RPN11
VIHASVLATEVAIDQMTGRLEQPDEIIEVLRVGEPPFHHLGRLPPHELEVVVDVTERVQEYINDRVRRAFPNETGGVLVGCHIDERPVVANAWECHDPDATPCTFRIRAGETKTLVENARHGDERLGYLGEWHSHPSGAGPSDLDTAAMLGAARESGLDRPVLLIAVPGNDGSLDLQAYVTSPAGLVQATICTTGDLWASEAPT